MTSDAKDLDRAFSDRVGGRVRELRTARSLSQRQMVDALREPEWRTLINYGSYIDWPQTTLAKVERGERPLSLREAAILSKFFNVELAELVPGLGSSVKAARVSALLDVQRDIRRRLERLDHEEG